MLTQGWQSKAAARWEHDALPFAANISLSHGQIFLFATYLWCVFKPVHHCVSPLYVHFWEWVEGHLFLGSKNLSSILVVVNKPNNNYLLYFTNVSNLVSQLTEAGTGSCGSLGENFSKLRSEVKKRSDSCRHIFIGGGQNSFYWTWRLARACLKSGRCARAGITWPPM